MRHAYLLTALASAAHLWSGEPPVSLRETVTPSALFALPQSDITLAGRVADAACTRVRLRVTTSAGLTSQASFAVTSRAFSCRYPADFAPAPPLEPGALFVDASDGR